MEENVLDYIMQVQGCVIILLVICYEIIMFSDGMLKRDLVLSGLV